ncbi:Na+/melibiose symporter [Ruminococcaceae bacterium YRB3002]|nr:Na+/melibiose symporter [Ruminococcaceae bacterium YRB3002]
MRLNYKNTFLAGLAFLSICAFWQMYDNVIPLILTKTFRMNETLSGFIMAADNILALFLLPLFGKLSDMTHTRLGKRMPYILFGTAASVILLNFLPVIDNNYALGNKGGLYTTAGFVIILGALLFVMSVWRSPAVALMPDITPKPLRSKGNAVINLMGAAGGIMYLVFAALMYPKKATEGVEHVNYRPLFVVISIIMVISVVIMLITVKEPRLAAENDEIERKHPEWDLTETSARGSAKLPRPVLKSMIFLLLSIGLWYIAYNAVTTWFTTYISSIMGEGIGGASTCFMIASGGALISYIPLGFLQSKIGRKKSILFGTLLLAGSYLVCYFLTTMMSSIGVITYIVFALVGVAWAAISINSLPMVVEMCRGSDSGKFTGYYYTASMAGQVLTPVLAGTLMRHVSYKILFIYATVFAFASFVTMLQVKHGDIKGTAKRGLAAFEEFE